MVNCSLVVVLNFCCKAMKKIAVFPYLLLIMIVWVSCATLKKDKLVEGQVWLTNKNLYLINGRYNRISIDSTSYDLFYKFLGGGGYVFWENEKDLNLNNSISLKVLDHKRIKATLFKNDSIVKTKILRGRLKSGYFELRRGYHIIPIIFFNSFGTHKIRIGLLGNSNLTTDYKEIFFGTFPVIIPFYNKNYAPKVEYKRLY